MLNFPRLINFHLGQRLLKHRAFHRGIVSGANVMLISGDTSSPHPYRQQLHPRDIQNSNSLYEEEEEDEAWAMETTEAMPDMRTEPDTPEPITTTAATPETTTKSTTTTTTTTQSTTTTKGPTLPAIEKWTWNGNGFDQVLEKLEIPLGKGDFHEVLVTFNPELYSACIKSQP